MTQEKLFEIEFTPKIEDFIKSRADKFVTVLTGANNSGKTLTLKFIKAILGESAYLIGINRFYHVYHLSVGIHDTDQEKQQWNSQFTNQFRKESHNYEQNYFDLNHLLQSMTDKKMDKLFDLCGTLIGCKFELKKVDPERELCPRFIDMDGQNVSVGSTGTRLLLTLLGICLDERFEVLLIDEPELGLSPAVQAAVSDFFQNPDTRKSHFPHLKHIFFATHAHLFLDRRDITSNFTIQKLRDTVSISQVETVSKLHNVQFNLLGNKLENMYFPAAVVVVEGKTDHKYIAQIIELKFAGKRVAVIPSGGDIKRKVYQLKEIFGDLRSSPYANRIFAVVDSVCQSGLQDFLEKIGIDQDQFVQWDKNGIEYLYPASILSKIFSCSESDLDKLDIEVDRVSLNGITKTKNELCENVLNVLSSTTTLPDELKCKLLTPISNSIEI